jgi:hypothetical protein
MKDVRDVLVCFSSKGREDYNGKLLRLVDSAIEHWKGDLLLWSPDHTLSDYKGWKIFPHYPDPYGLKTYSHNLVPYQFKIAAIQKAVEEGYDRVAWLDSGMIIQKDLTPLFDPETGVTVFHNLGHPLYKYISEDACKLLGITEADLPGINQIWGGALFFDFTIKNARMVFEKIKVHSVDGSFCEGGSARPGFVAHRHDQAVMSVLVHGKCRMLPYGKIKCPPHDTTGEYGNDCYLVSK